MKEQAQWESRQKEQRVQGCKPGGVVDSTGKEWGERELV